MQTDNLTTDKTFAWLNENSRKFLAAGYLGEGITAEERIANMPRELKKYSKCRDMLKNFIITCHKVTIL